MDSLASFPSCAPPWRRLALWAGAVCWAVCLPGCLVVPVSTEVYDRDCRILSRHMELQAVQVAAVASCRGQECGAMLVFIGATAAASAVVSGSIVVVGNVAYWFEKQGRCNRQN